MLAATRSHQPLVSMVHVQYAAYNVQTHAILSSNCMNLQQPLLTQAKALITTIRV